MPPARRTRSSTKRTPAKRDVHLMLSPRAAAVVLEAMHRYKPRRATERPIVEAVIKELDA